jgi:hypothetical protein
VEWVNQKEVERFAVINRVLDGHSSQALAAQQLGLSVRSPEQLRPNSVPT